MPDRDGRLGRDLAGGAAYRCARKPRWNLHAPPGRLTGCWQGRPSDSLGLPHLAIRGVSVGIVNGSMDGLASLVSPSR